MTRRRFIYDAALGLMVPFSGPIIKAAAIVQRPANFGSVGGGSGITVDLWQDFEIASLSNANLNGSDHNAGFSGWNYTDASARMSISASAQQTAPHQINSTTDTGANGLASDTTTGHLEARYIYANIAKGAAAVSVGVWIKMPASIGTGIGQQPLFFMYGGGSVVAQMSIGTSGTTPVAFIEAASASSGITLALNNWYWFTTNFQQNSTCSLAVYNTSSVQVGSTVTTPGRNDTSSLVVLGNFNPYTGYNCTWFYDNLVIDYTNHTFPIVP